MAGNVKKEIEENDILVLVIPDDDYADSVVKIAGILSDSCKRVCYVSLNKPRESIVNKLKDAKVDHSKFFFIDAAGKGIDGKDVVYVSSPKALTELSIAINKAFSGSGIDSGLFDSLSTLLVYEESSAVIRFAHSIISAFRSRGAKVVFTCLKGDTKSELIKDLSMFVDSIENM
jgi:KaiC/GvpD/RAD55 family RecA-like ATPase